MKLTVCHSGKLIHIVTPLTKGLKYFYMTHATACHIIIPSGMQNNHVIYKISLTTVC